ncbi:MAG: hypothetical protein AMXMBFR36_37910 [Acidobacteriota bacterium]
MIAAETEGAPAVATASRRRGRRWLAGLLALASAAVVFLRAPAAPCRDFCTYYSAGLLVREGRAAAAYDRRELAAAHRAAHASPFGVGPWLYSPVWLPPAAALAALPFERAEAVHRLLGAAALGFGLLFVLARIASPALQLAVAGAFALSHPAWVALVMQNWSWLLFAAVAAAWWAGERGRDGWAGLGWAAAVHLKAFVVLAPVALLVTGRRGVALRAAALAALVAALALPATGVAPWQRYLGFLDDAKTAGVTPYYNKVSLQATAARFASEPRDWVAPRGKVATPVVRGLFWLGLPLYALGLARLRRSPAAALAFALAFVLLFVPQIWDHTELLLFAALPALPRRHLLALTALLAASAAYNALQQPLLHEVLRGEKPPLALQSLLLWFPAVNLLALGAALAAGRESAGAPADARAA